MVEQASWDDAAARVGGCSGALVARDVVLTAAHCLAGAIASIEVGAEHIAVHGCLAHPLFRPGDVKHDLAICRLERYSSTPPLTLGLHRAVERDAAVTLLGFGSAIPFGPPARSARRVTTTITAIREGVLVIGTPERTACTGDSGAPVLTANGEVIGIVQGTTGRFCASPADVVPLAANSEWLVTQLRMQDQTGGTMPATLIVVILGVFVLVRGLWIRKRKAARERRRSEEGNR